jgi:hypothetical protein
MEAQGGEDVNAYSFTTSALYRDEWSASRPGRALPPGGETNALYYQLTIIMFWYIASCSLVEVLIASIIRELSS